MKAFETLFPIVAKQTEIAWRRHNTTIAAKENIVPNLFRSHCFKQVSYNESSDGMKRRFCFHDAGVRTSYVGNYLKTSRTVCAVMTSRVYDPLAQGFSTCGTRTPNGTFVFFQGMQ